MRCDLARERLSAAMDGELHEAVWTEFDAHLSTCVACQQHEARVRRIRETLRDEPEDAVPDVTARVIERVGRRAHSPWRSVSVAVAVFVVAFATGAVFVGVDLRDPRAPVEIVAAGVPERIAAAQPALERVEAAVTVLERGWHPDVAERRYQGRLGYRAPGELLLELNDETRYPDERWVANDVTVAVDSERWWTQGPATCPAAALPECTPRQPRTRAVERLEPFSEATVLPLELVLPVRSFTGAEEPASLGVDRIQGRRAVGVEITVAQGTPLLDGLLAAGNWREVHPADRVELWLDDQWLVPLRLRVLPADLPERRLWASRRGYDDDLGWPVLEVQLTDVRVGDAAEPPEVPVSPDGVAARDAGFWPGDGGIAPEPGWLPEGMRPHLAGTVGGDQGPVIGVRTWTDGRAWLKIRATEDWAGGRLFGDVGLPVHVLDLGEAGVGYASVDHARVAVHASAVDVVVSGSVDAEALVRVASSLGMAGRPVPPTWAEAGTGDLAEARAAVSVLLEPHGLDGFGEPAVQLHAGAVTLAYAGSGARGFVLTQADAERLTPPLDGDVVGVEVRGVAGRYTPALGELEWLEEGVVISVRSRTLPLAELLGIAEALEPR